MKRRAVIAGLWPTHTQALDPFLAQYGPVVIVSSAAFATEHLHKVAAAHGCEVVILDTLLQPDHDTAQPAAQSLEALWPTLAAAGPLADRLGGPGGDALPALIERELSVELPSSIRMLDALEAARRQFNIVLFVTTEDVTPLYRPATAWAVAHGIPSLHVAHSIALADPFTVHAHLVADRLAVYGQRGAEGYLDLGIAPERIAVTGNPDWDAYARFAGRHAEVRSELDRRYSLDPALPLVVFATTWPGHMTAHEPAGDTNFASLQAFANACAELAAQGVAVNAIVKDRSNNADTGSASLARAVAAAGAGEVRFVRTLVDTQELAAVADVVVGVDSNLLVEAMLNGTPVINLVADDLAALGPTFEEESGVVEAEPRRLAEEIRRLIQDSGFRAERLSQIAARSTYYNFGGIDGRSAERVGSLLASMALPPGRGAVLVEEAYRRGRSVGGRAYRRVRAIGGRVRRLAARALRRRRA